MRVYLVEHRGRIQEIMIESLTEPTPAPGEVLINIVAVGLIPIDIQVLDSHLAPRVTLPVVLSVHVSGAVRATGANISNFEPVDTVLSVVNLPGTDERFNGHDFGEYIPVPAIPRVKKLAVLTFEAATAMAAAALICAAN